MIPADLPPYPGKQRIDSHQKLLRRQPPPFGIPHPLVPHRANAAFEFAHLGNAAQRRSHHVAMFQSRDKLVALLRIVAQPVQQLGKPPFVRVHASAPFDSLKPQRVRLAGNLLGLGKGAMIAPQVILVQRFQPLTDGNHARSSRIQCNGRNHASIHPGRAQSLARGRGQRCHLVGVRLRGIVWVFAPAVKRI